MNILKTLIITLLATSAASAQSYQIDWHVIASGGGHAESENFQADGTIGQGIVGQSLSDNFIVDAGYWVGVGPPGDCVYIPGDCNHNGVPLELADVITMIGMFTGAVPPAYTCSCPPHGDNFAPEADPNGNCIVFELADVVTEIGAFQGVVIAEGCDDCPGQGRLLPGNSDQPFEMPSLKSKVKFSRGKAGE